MTDFCSFLKKDRDKREILSLISSLPSSYVGNKRRILPKIWDFLEENDVKFNSVFDAFSGSGMVSLMFKFMEKNVTCNDILSSASITSSFLMEGGHIPLSDEEIDFLCYNVPENYGSFVRDSYIEKFFTEKECDFLDRYRANAFQFKGHKFYCAIEILNKATLASIPNSNFSVYGKDLKAIRSSHTVGESFWNEKWRDTTRKRRDENNEIKYPESIKEIVDKYNSSFSLFSDKDAGCHFNGVRYFDDNGFSSLESCLGLTSGANEFSKEASVNVLNADVIHLLEEGSINTDLIYLDPPYGGASSDYAVLYRFLEEFLHGKKLEDLPHIQKGAKRFVKSKGYQDQLESLLALCGNIDTWMLSYNESSFADLETIKKIIEKSGRNNIITKSVPITYQYRKKKSSVDIEDFKKHYYEDGYKYLDRGTEYLILAKK